MRQGEFLALRWEDVDLNEGVIHIRRTLARSGGRIALGEPKTKGSRRPVHLMGAAVEALRSHLERQLEDIERLGDLYHDHGLVFTSEVGTLINPTNVRRRSFAPLLERARLPQITPPRPARHLRDAAADPQRAPQVRPGTPGPRHRGDIAGHLFPRDPRDGQPHRACDGRRILLGPPQLSSRRVGTRLGPS